MVENRTPKTTSETGRDAGAPGHTLAGSTYLDGQLLIAMPVMDDERFARSVIYVCAHSADGAMGIIVNRPAGSIDFPQLLRQLDIVDELSAIELAEDGES